MSRKPRNPDLAGKAASDPFQPGLLYRLPKPPHKVAILRASRIGDFICATPAFRALRAALPDAEITIITLPLLQDLALRSPYFDSYAAFPGFPGIAEQFFDARSAVRFFADMQAENFDLAIQMQGSGVYSNPFTLLLGAQATAGFVRPEDPPGHLDAALPFPSTGHEIQRTLALAAFLGAASQDYATEYPLWPQDHARAEALLEGARPPLIGLHPGARDRTRRWPLERFAAAGKELLHRFEGTLVLIGESGDSDKARALRQAAGDALLDLTGLTSLGALGAVIARLHLLVTNDSGPAHIAYALGTPTVTIFGGADLDRYCALSPGPFHMLAYAVDCRPCTFADCPIGYVCLNNVTVDQVIAAGERAIREAISGS